MFDDVLNRLFGKSQRPLGGDDARLALAALLVRIAKSDADYAQAEIALIDDILAKRYAIDAGQAADLRAQAETVECNAPDTVRFTRAIKNAVPYEDRQDVLRALWQIVLADGHTDAEESAMLRLIAPMLGVSDRDSNLIRQQVAANLDQKAP
jgi:uncharacterized tellurite resistance protein B-like protein